MSVGPSVYNPVPKTALLLPACICVGKMGLPREHYRVIYISSTFMCAPWLSGTFLLWSCGPNPTKHLHFLKHSISPFPSSSFSLPSSAVSSSSSSLLLFITYLNCCPSFLEAIQGLFDGSSLLRGSERRSEFLICFTWERLGSVRGEWKRPHMVGWQRTKVVLLRHTWSMYLLEWSLF